MRPEYLPTFKIQPSVMLRQGGSTLHKTFPSMRSRIAEREGDHASSQDIADLIGRTGACGRWRAPRCASEIWPFEGALEKNPLLFGCATRCRWNRLTRTLHNCRENWMSTPTLSIRKPRPILYLTILALLTLTGASASSRAAPLPQSAPLSMQGSHLIIPVRAAVRSSAVRVGPRGGAVVRGGGVVAGPRGGAAARRTAVIGPRGNVIVAGGGHHWTRPFWYRWPAGGAIAAGAAIGFAAAETASPWAGSPPVDGMCWYYTDGSRSHGFWDECPQ